MLQHFSRTESGLNSFTNYKQELILIPQNHFALNLIPGNLDYVISSINLNIVRRSNSSLVMHAYGLAKALCTLCKSCDLDCVS